MNESKISVRYAKALFLTASEAGQEKVIMDDITKVSKTFRLPELKVFLESPVIKKSQKKEMFTALFGEWVNPLIMDFLDLLLHHNREGFTVRIGRYYKKLYYEKNGILDTTITIPVAISKEQRMRIMNVLKESFNQEIELTELVKPEIIGGFILRAGDKQYDASVRQSIQRMKKTLLLK